MVAAFVLLALWSLGGATAYSYAVLVPVTVLSPLLTGYQVVTASDAHGLKAIFEAGGARYPAPFVLRDAFAGVIPFVGLMCATAGQTLTQWASRTAIGVAVLYAAHVAILLLGPLLVTEHERWITRLIDVTYGFYAVAGFVGLPFSLWMIETKPWESLQAPAAVPPPAPAKEAKIRKARK